MPEIKNTSHWFNCLHPRPSATYRVICFPWCGGGSQFYARWGGEFPENIEVVGVRFPGREIRTKEQHISDLSRLVRQVCEEINKQYGDKPFAFFGHSMGSVLCYEAAVYLKEKHGKVPQHIFFSSDYAPHSKIRKERAENPNYRPLHEYTDVELVKRIGEHGGTPKTFLDNIEFMVNTFLPPYRNDLKMIARYCRNFRGKSPLTCPITAFDGDRDVSHNLSEYAELTSDKYQQIKLPGGHFYLLKEENSRRLRDIIVKALP